MILYKDMRYCTNSDHPNDDWVGDADYVIPDGSELAEKIIGLFPNFTIVIGDDGNIADVTAAEYVPADAPPEPPTNAELAAAIAELAEVVMNG